MSELKKCPCGEIPDSLHIIDTGNRSKYADAMCDKCGEWKIEFRTKSLSLDSKTCEQLANDSWNDATRGL